MNTISKYRIVLGVPGSGKTTYMLNKVKEHRAQGIPLEDMAYLSFTRKATREALERFAWDKSNGVSVTSLRKKYGSFRTIHARAYKALGQPTVVNAHQMIEFAKATGFEINPIHFRRRQEDAEMFVPFNPHREDLFPAMDSLYRSNPEMCRKNKNFYSRRFQQYMMEYFKFKRDRGLIDYTDMLTLYLDKKMTEENVRVAFIDEAQDLSTLQWKVVLQMFKGAELMYVGGDDQQAIYKYGGADPDQIAYLHGDIQILDQSHRLPKVIAQVCNRLGDKMTVPVHKHIIGQKKPGYYKWIASMKEYKLPVKGKVYMLGRTKYNLEPFIEWCKSHGVMYQLACTEWPVLNSMEYIMAQKGTEKKDLLDQPEKTYFIHVGKETGNLFNTLGRVYIGTIHSVKGGEADHVLLSTDTSKATSEAYRMDPDGEHRVFYTAMSRAKIGVTLLMPSTPYAYLDLERIEKHGEGD